MPDSTSLGQEMSRRTLWPWGGRFARKFLPNNAKQLKLITKPLGNVAEALFLVIH
jgi:hypothetical protein